MSGAPDFEHIAVTIAGGIPIDDVTLEETVALIGGFVDVGRATGRTFQVATINVDFVVTAQHDALAMSILRNAELCLPDGMPIVWHSQITGARLRTRVTGADLVPALVERAARTGHRILLFGSAPGVAERAAILLATRHPGAAISGISGPVISDVAELDPSDLAAIRNVKPDIVCVALGNPKQEKWIDAHRHALGCPVLIGVGGTLDFLVGSRRRAPTWMQNVGLEWVFRAAQEPRRLGRRYAHDARVFGPHLARAGWRRAGGIVRRQRTKLPVIDPAGVVDASTTEIGDVDAVERLIGIVRDARRAGVPAAIDGASAQVEALLGPYGSSAVVHFGRSGAAQ